MNQIFGSFDRDAKGKLIIYQNSRGQLVDKHGRRVNRRGYLVDNRGNIVNHDLEVVFEVEELESDGEIPQDLLERYLDEEERATSKKVSSSKHLQYRKPVRPRRKVSKRSAAPGG